jgi:hypothetical protein
LAGKSASSPLSYIDFGSLFSQVNVVIWLRVWWFCLKSFSKSQKKTFLNISSNFQVRKTILLGLT